MYGLLKTGTIKNLLHKKIIAAFLGSCFFVCSCENKLETVAGLGKKKMGIEEATNIESLLSQEGKLKARLTAPYMLRYQMDTPKVEFPKKLKVDFYGDNMVLESRLSANYAMYRESENKVFLRDSIIVYNLKGDTLRTNELYWDQQKEMFYTDKNVILSQPTQKLYGTGMEADQNFKKIRIFNIRNSFMVMPDSSFLNIQ